MASVTWDEALRVLAGGDHSLAGVETVRRAFDVLKVPQLPIHSSEVAEIERLRSAAKRNLARITEIESRAGGA